MEHVVFFPAQDGSPAFRRVGTLEEAVGLVEHLRNVEGVSEVSVNALTEVPMSFKAWYRVELPAAVEVPAVPAPVVEAVAGQELPAAEVPADAPVRDNPAMPAPVLVVSGSHAAETPASLGFFA